VTSRGAVRLSVDRFCAVAGYPECAAETTRRPGKRRAPPSLRKAAGAAVSRETLQITPRAVQSHGHDTEFPSGRKAAYGAKARTYARTNAASQPTARAVVRGAHAPHRAGWSSSWAAGTGLCAEAC